ncbi:hypothetical protein PFISCL1PPCAC_21081, partial [Pristionchus fissidentatus]
VLSSSDWCYDQLHLEWLGFEKNLVQNLLGMPGKTGFHSIEVARGAKRMIQNGLKTAKFVRGYRALIDPTTIKRAVAGNEYFELFTTLVTAGSVSMAYNDGHTGVLLLVMAIRAWLEADFRLMNLHWDDY